MNFHNAEDAADITLNHAWSKCRPLQVIFFPNCVEVRSKNYNFLDPLYSPRITSNVLVLALNLCHFLYQSQNWVRQLAYCYLSLISYQWPKDNLSVLGKQVITVKTLETRIKNRSFE